MFKRFPRLRLSAVSCLMSAVALKTDAGRMVMPEHESEPTPRRRANHALALARGLALAGSVSMTYAQVLAEMAVAGNDSDRHDASMRATQGWARTCLRLCGLRPKVLGPPPPPGSLLIPNHISYIDVAVIAAASPAYFVAKSEVEDWPFIGSMLLGSGHLLVKRSKARALLETADAIGSRLADGRRVCIFMEGTTSGGDRILPFLPSMFKPAIELGAPIVPVGVRWHPPSPDVSVSEDLAYWREAHTFVPHLWRLLGLPGFEGEIVFGEPMQFPRTADRRSVSETLRAEVMRLTGLPAGIKEPGA